MASAEQKIADDKITADALYNGQVAKAEPSEGIFQCGKCKLWKVRFAILKLPRAAKTMPTPFAAYCDSLSRFKASVYV